MDVGDTCWSGTYHGNARRVETMMNQYWTTGRRQQLQLCTAVKWRNESGQACSNGSRSRNTTEGSQLKLHCKWICIKSFVSYTSVPIFKSLLRLGVLTWDLIVLSCGWSYPQIQISTPIQGSIMIIDFSCLDQVDKQHEEPISWQLAEWRMFKHPSNSSILKNCQVEMMMRSDHMSTWLCHSIVSTKLKCE